MLAVTNIMGSQATRDADGVLYTRAGLEVGVAATKTFLAQVVVMNLLAVRMAELRGTMARRQLREAITQLKHLPTLVTETLASVSRDVRRIAEERHGAEFFMYIGRHIGLYDIARSRGLNIDQPRNLAKTVTVE